MTEKIRETIDKAFASVEQTDSVRELKEELLQNLNDKYNDLVASGMAPEDACRTVIDGLGDLRELVDSVRDTHPVPFTPQVEDGRRFPEAAKEQTFTQAVTSVSADWVSGKVRVCESADDAVHVVELAGAGFPQNQLFTAQLAGGRLVIRDPRGKLGTGLFGLGWMLIGRDAELEIYLPRHRYQAVEIGTVSASITLETPLEADKQRLHTVSGSLTSSGACRECRLDSTSGRVRFTGSADTLSLDTVSGAIELEGTVRQCKIEAVSGRITANFDAPPESVKVSAVSGSVHLGLPENDGFTLRFDKVSGSFSSDFPLSEQNKVRIYKQGGTSYSVSTVSGSCHLKRREPGRA